MKKNKLTTLFKHFNVSELFQDILPKQQNTYIYLGIFLIITTNTDIYFINENIVQKYIYLYNIINYITMIIAGLILIYPIWLLKFKNTLVLSLLWIFCIFYTLIFSDGLLIIVSHYNKFQIIIYMIDLIIVAVLLRWYIALLLTITGVLASGKFYKYYMGVDSLPQNEFAEFNIIYYLILFVLILIFFLRPKQKQQEIAEAKNIHLRQLVHDREEELLKLLDLKHEFLRNINHEIHTPMTGITSLGETLWEKYDDLSEKQRKQAVSVIARSSRRLNSLMNNILDFSKLSSLTYNLQKENINFSDLVDERVRVCSELYLNNKELDFILDIEENIIVNCDKYYIKQTLDNLIINSITYSNNGFIRINLKKLGSDIKFTIRDDGVGVPEEELDDIFGVFMVSSKTKTPAGGRGMGLALCKKVLEVHEGRMWAENDKNGKTSFIFTMSLK